MKREKKISDKLPVIQFPASTIEWEMRKVAEEYNSLTPNAPRRKELLKRYESLEIEAEFD